jgi:hypothetical protein
MVKNENSIKSDKFNFIPRFYLILVLLVAGLTTIFILINDGPAQTIYLPVIGQPYTFVRSSYGVTMYEGTPYEGGLQLLKEAGCEWATFMVHWNEIEPNAPVGGVHTYSWTQLDYALARLKAAGIQPFILFSSNPSWAALAEAGPVKEDQLHNLAAVAQTLAERYDCDGGPEDAAGSICVTHWSFYPEPDRKDHWGYEGAKYGEMLALVSQAIHQANASAKVINGGVAYDRFVEDNPTYLFVKNFLPTVLNTLAGFPGGVPAYLDGLAFHYYKLTFPSIGEKAAALRNILGLYGAGQLPLMCPETGYHSSTKSRSSETLQAYELAKIFVEGAQAGVNPIMWFKFYDTAWADSAEDTASTYTMGLRRLDRSLKPSYFRFKRLATSG